MKEPLKPDDARRLIREILTGGTLAFSSHALDELVKDGLTTVDCVNVLRAGVVEAPEPIDGTWRYRVRTNTICVVVAFRSETRLKAITAWRTKR